ncbi:MAG: pyridoxal-phosphate dependent enzyme, partial [Sediminibacterium sp.]|nr:pyridoxal-phosphate dependent enzyme [Sediminibacterium sp.]
MILAKPSIQPLRKFFYGPIPVDVLKLHEIHPIVSGNKWYKLRYYLEEATVGGYNAVITRGGPYSNHLVATAFAAKEVGLKSYGLVRGYQPPQLSSTLQDAIAYGMQLYFTGYNNTSDDAAFVNTIQNGFYIPEGGMGVTGIRGAATILSEHTIAEYTHIIVAAGTGTMVAGVTIAAMPHQKVMGISVLKNAPAPINEIAGWLQTMNHTRMPEILHFPYGGYAKLNNAVVETMHTCWEQEKLPLDFVYTGKLFTAVKELLHQNYFPPDSNLLLVHSGGLQGNRSLPPN